MGHLGGLTADIWRLNTVPPVAIHKVENDPMDGDRDVPSGIVSAGLQGCTGTLYGRCWPTPSLRATGDRLRPGAPTLRQAQEEPFRGVIDRILEDDQRVARKQRHTANRIFERLRDEYRFDGKYTIVEDYVRERRRQTREMFVPLSHPPGQAQCDFGEGLVVIRAGLFPPRTRRWRFSRSSEVSRTAYFSLTITATPINTVFPPA